MLIDYIVFFLVFTPATYFVKGVWIMTPRDHLWVIFDPICAVFLGVIIIYSVLMEWLFGQTIGKMMLKLKVVTRGGEKIHFRQSLYRFLGRLVDGLFFYLIGILIVNGNDEKQRFGDKIAGTVVIKK